MGKDLSEVSTAEHCSHFVAEDETMEECINKVLLAEIPTSEIVAELATREEVDIHDVDGEFYINFYKGGVVGCCKCKILVVRE